MAVIKGILKQVGKDLLRAAFPNVYNVAQRYRKISRRTNLSSEDLTKNPVVKALHNVHQASLDSNEIATDTLEAILVQNDILGKIAKEGLGEHGAKSILGFLDDILAGTRLKKPAFKGSRVAPKGSGRVARPGAVKGNGRFGRILGAGDKVLGRVAPIVSGTMEGINEYKRTGDLAKAGVVGVGTAAGSMGGAALGAAVGQVLIPVPILGALIGGFLGGVAGGYAGSEGSRAGYDYFNERAPIIPKTERLMNMSNVHTLNYIATDILMKAQNIELSALEIIMPQEGRRGTPLEVGDGSSPVFRPSIGGRAAQRAQRVTQGIEGGKGEDSPRVSQGTGASLTRPKQGPGTNKGNAGGTPGGKGVDVSTLPIPENTQGNGKYNLYSSSGIDPRGDYAKENIVPVDTPYGTINVNKNSAAAFKGFFEEMKAEGAPLKSLGSYSLRQKRSAGAGHNPGGGWSEHAFGNALDMDNATSLSPEMQRWIAEDPSRFERIKQKFGIKQGIKGDLPHIEFGGVLSPEAKAQFEKAKKSGELVTGTPKTPEQEKADYVESVKNNPFGVGKQAEPVKPPPGPLSYNVDYPKILSKVKEQYPMASWMGDKALREKVQEETSKRHPSLKFEGDRVTGDKSEIDKLSRGVQEKFNLNAEDFIRPVETPAAIEAPGPAPANPAMERLRTERDKLKRDLSREKKKHSSSEEKGTGAEKTKKAGGEGDEDAPPPKDNTRSDRALMNINPQLHEEDHPQ